MVLKLRGTARLNTEKHNSPKRKNVLEVIYQ